MKKKITLAITIISILTVFFALSMNTFAIETDSDGDGIPVANPADSPVCEVDGVQYNTLDEAITAAAEGGDTIKLLEDINYSGGLAPTFDMYINLNGYTLDVVNDSGIGLYADGYDLDIFGEGELNVTGTGHGIEVRNGASVEITNAAATDTYGIAVYVWDSGSFATVYGTASANNDDSIGVLCSVGNAYIQGDVSAAGANGKGVWAQNGAEITVDRDITATNYVLNASTIKTPAEYDSDTDGYYIYTDGTNTVNVKHTVCAIGATEYKWLDNALDTAVSGDTITLLDDIRYDDPNKDIVLTDKDLHLDLNTYTLDIGWTGSNPALKVDGGDLTIDDSDGGQLNIVDGINGVKVLNGGTATVTSISKLTGIGVIGESGGSVTVTGDIGDLVDTSKRTDSGVSLLGGATAHVMGNIITRLNGITVQQNGSEAVVDGNVSASSGQGVYVTTGGSIIVKGDVYGNYRPVQGGSGGGSILIMGDVVADRWEGVYAFSDSDIVIDGSVTSPYGLYAWAEGTTVLVKGNTVTTSDTYEGTTDPTYGAYAFNGAKITVGGTITPATTANYVKVGETVMTEAEGVLQGHYTVYSDGTSAVRLKGIEFYQEDFESESLEGWTTPHTNWVLTDSLTNPTATAHSGSQVAMFNSYDAAFGLEEPFYQTTGLNLTNGSAYQLEFWMYHDNANETCYDSITVQISTDGGSSWTPIGSPYYRYSDTTGWQKAAVSLNAYVGESDVRIAFLGHCQQGGNIFIDDVTVSHECIIDGCSTTEAYGGYISSQQIEGETYYEVSTAEQLAHINEHLDLNFIQTADIDLADYNGGNWIPIGGFGDPNDYCTPEYFTGKYLGDGHLIDNLYIYFHDEAQNATHSGIFAYIDGTDSCVKDLTVTVSGAQIDNYNYAHFGAIAANMEGGSIDNCHVVFEGDIITGDTPNGYAGGVIGSAYPIYDSESDSYVGSIENCTVTFNTGSLLTEGWSKSAGGIAGLSASSIINCQVVINEGQMIKAPNVGGIAGHLSKMRSMGKYLENCSVTGAGTLELSSQKYYTAAIGGIAATSFDGDLRNCNNEVDVIANLTMINDDESAFAGGIVGYTSTNSSIFGCDNTGAVTLTIADNVVDNYGDPTTPGGEEYAYAGGITGFINGYSRASVIENCENNANITAINLIPTNRAYAGGIVGHIECDDADNAGVTVKNCANTDSDKTVAAYGGSTLTGGIAGSSTYTDFDTPNIVITNCYNYSEVYSESNSAPKVGTMCIGLTAGGIIGAAGEITINYCYSTAPDVDAVNNDGGDAYIGGIVGLIYNTALSQNYYETNSNVTRAAGGIVSGMDIVAQADLAGNYEGATATQLKTKSFYGSGWSWYTSGGNAPDYYSSTNPWRMTSDDSYPLLKGTLYEEPENPSGGGGGGGSVSSSIVVTTEETGNHTTNSTEVEADTKSGTSSADVSGAIINALLDKAEDTNGTGKGDILELAIDTPNDIDGLKVIIEQDDLNDIAQDTDASLSITSPFISITFDAKALETISGAESGGDVVISASVIDSSTLSEADQAKVKDRPVYDLSVTNGDTQVSDFGGGHATVAIPYALQPGENPHAVVIYYLADDGSLQTVRGHYDADSKTVIFTTTHFSQFILGYNQVVFDDIPSTAWYSNAVTFIAARGITSGTSPGTYSPNGQLTRGQFVVLLMNAYQITTQDTVGTVNFSDAGNTYYTDYLLQAKALGIVNGIGDNQFAPQKEITRQEMIVMLYNALDVIDEVPNAIKNRDLTSFNDGDLVADWASEAMTALVNAGIISGSDNNLDPKSGTTRAEIAQVLYNLLAK